MENRKSSKYVPADLEIIRLARLDIITTSPVEDDDMDDYVPDENIDFDW